MKKILITLFLLVSIGILASDGPFEMQENMIENNLQMNYSSLTDGKITLKNIDYDVDIYTNGSIVELEMDVMTGDGGWMKFNKKVFNQWMVEISKKIKKDVNNLNLPINIIFKIDKKIGEDIIVYSETF